MKVVVFGLTEEEEPPSTGTTENETARLSYCASRTGGNQGKAELMTDRERREMRVEEDEECMTSLARGSFTDKNEESGGSV